MKGYNFTERVRKVLAMAREDAARRGHDFVSPLHMLAAVIEEGEGVACAALQNLRVDLGVLAQEVDAHAGRGESPSPSADIPFTSRAKKVLEFAMRAAGDLNHPYVGVEHLVLGLYGPHGGAASDLLAAHGAPHDTFRAEVLRLLGPDWPGPPAALPPRSQTATVMFAQANVTGFTDASAERDSEKVFLALDEYYTLANTFAVHSGGRFIKGMGDSVLFTFPKGDPQKTIIALQQFQKNANAHWETFDRRCRVHIKIGAGTVSLGRLGPPGAAHFDVVGDAVNRFFRAPGGEFVIMPEVRALLERTDG